MIFAAIRRFVFAPHWLGLIVAGWAFLLFYSAPQRGFDESGLWQIEHIEAASQVMSPDGAPEHLLTTVPQRGPMNGFLPAALWQWVRGGSASDVARLANILFVCLTAWFVFSVARRVGGPLAGLGAAVSLISVPRIWGVATSPGLTAGALFVMTAAAVCMARSRDRFRWFFPAVTLLVVAALTIPIAALLFLPWIALTFFSQTPSNERGLLQSRPLTLWGPAVFPLAALVTVLLVPPLTGGGSLADYFAAFLQLPREPTLYFSEVFSNERLPWHASFVLTALTVGPTVLFLSVFGLSVGSGISDRIRRRLNRGADDGESPESLEARRLAWSMLLLTVFLPLLFGTTFSHGVDLLALILPWFAVFAGIGLHRVMSVIGKRLHSVFARQAWARFATLAVLTTLGWGVFVFAFKDTEEVFPEVESYYNWFVGGVDGATESGLPRYPHGPLPLHFLNSLVEEGAEAQVAILGTHDRIWAVLDRYRSDGLVRQGLSFTSMHLADIVVIRFDEISEDFYRQIPDFYDTANSVGPDSQRWLSLEGIPLFGAIRVRQ